MAKRILIIILIVLGGLFLIYKLADIFSPGSYGHAEKYELNYPENEVIDAITKLKSQDNDLVVPKVSIQNSGQWDLNDGKEKETDNWYKFYFYDRDKNQILFTWTRPSGPNTTTFALISINQGLDLGHWKDINDDFGFTENREVINSFETSILKRVQDILTDNK